MKILEPGEEGHGYIIEYDAGYITPALTCEGGTCSNANLIREFESYKRLETKQEGVNERDVPLKANDHALDALRYFVISFCQGHIGDRLALWPDQ